MWDIGLSASNASGAKAAAPFSVTSGGSKSLTLIVVAAAAVAIVLAIVFIRWK